MLATPARPAPNATSLSPTSYVSICVQLNLLGSLYVLITCFNIKRRISPARLDLPKRIAVYTATIDLILYALFMAQFFLTYSKDTHTFHPPMPESTCTFLAVAAMYFTFFHLLFLLSVLVYTYFSTMKQTFVMALTRGVGSVSSTILLALVPISAAFALVGWTSYGHNDDWCLMRPARYALAIVYVVAVGLANIVGFVIVIIVWKRFQHWGSMRRGMQDGQLVNQWTMVQTQVWRRCLAYLVILAAHHILALPYMFIIARESEASTPETAGWSFILYLITIYSIPGVLNTLAFRLTSLNVLAPNPNPNSELDPDAIPHPELMVWLPGERRVEGVGRGGGDVVWLVKPKQPGDSRLSRGANSSMGFSAGSPIDPSRTPNRSAKSRSKAASNTVISSEGGLKNNTRNSGSGGVGVALTTNEQVVLHSPKYPKPDQQNRQRGWEQQWEAERNRLRDMWGSTTSAQQASDPSNPTHAQPTSPTRAANADRPRPSSYQTPASPDDMSFSVNLGP